MTDRIDPTDTERSGDPAGPGRQHILIVDDEVALGVIMRRQLEGRGYQVTAHTSSLEALADFTKRPQAFDLLVTDNTMPGMTGLALSKAILAQRPELPILLISGAADAEVAAGLGAKGPTAVLAKPHSGEQLVQAVASLIGPPAKAPGPSA